MGVEDRRADIRGSRNVGMACPGGAACAAACDGLAEAGEVPAVVVVVGDVAAELSRSGEGRAIRGHRGELAVGRAMMELGLEPVRLRSEEQRGEHEFVGVESVRQVMVDVLV